MTHETRIPELWWSPAECSVYADREGAAPHYLTMRDTGRLGQLPPDAVHLVGPDQRRPVVLLRADDCDCGPPYEDCPHGPEPVDALDLAVWLHAEASWRAEQNQRELARLYSHHHDFVAQAAAERDALQARLTAITETLGRADGMMATDSRDWGRDRSDVWLYGLLVGWECDETHEHDEFCGGDEGLREVALRHAWTADDVLRIRRFRAALHGDQPTEGTTP